MTFPKFTLRWFHVGLSTAAIFVLLAFVTNVPTRLEREDIFAIKAFLNLEKPPDINNFEDEIRVIQWVQAQILNAAPGNEPIPDYQDREPMDLLKTKSGLCYDRARSLDKAYTWIGFESRHVYIMFADKHSGTGAWPFIRQALSFSYSHAVTEVKTSRGWLMVDSNSPWISLDNQGFPVSAEDVHIKRSNFQAPPEYIQIPFWAVPGMYSRRGQFFRPYIPFPEFNWADFLKWAASSE
jgi:hypothetical protein